MAAGIAASVAQAVAGVVRDTLLALLTNGRSHPSLPERDRHEWSRHHPPPLWGGPDQPDDPMWSDEQEPPSPVWDNPEDRWPGSSNDWHLPVAPAEQPTTQPGVRRWVSALEAGWQAARWWLARRPGRYPVLTALVIGLAAGADAWAVGPLAAAGMGLVGTAFGLVSLAEAAGNSASTLAGA